MWSHSSLFAHTHPSIDERSSRAYVVTPILLLTIYWYDNIQGCRMVCPVCMCPILLIYFMSIVFHAFRYIFVSVSTTTFLWVVFLPSYFTMFYSYHQAALLAFCLILNASITLLCLFVPKIFALYFVEEDSMTFSSDIGQASLSRSVSTMSKSSTASNVMNDLPSTSKNNI